jgi:hypothetical protein
MFNVVGIDLYKRRGEVLEVPGRPRCIARVVLDGTIHQLTRSCIAEGLAEGGPRECAHIYAYPNGRRRS